MRIIYFGLLTIIIGACSSSSKKTDEQTFINTLNDSSKNAILADDTVINTILQQIPSPLEISALLKSSGTKYDVTFLNTIDNLHKYNTNYQRALNLGIFGTDLGYTNIYEQSKDGILYVSAVKTLADKLQIGQFFNIQTIKRLSLNHKDLDSLLLLTTHNFNTINHHFQTQNRSNLSVLLLVGGWLEAMQIACQVSSKSFTKNVELNEKIGEQKIILDQLIRLLYFYKEDKNIAVLLEDMEALKNAYNSIQITYTYRESSTKVINGMAIIKDNSSSSVSVTPKDIENIKNIINSIRNKIIS